MTLAEHLLTPDLVDWSNPVNAAHPRARGLAAWWMAVPNRAGWGSFTWRDLCRKNNGTLTDATPSTTWKGGYWQGDGTNDSVQASNFLTAAPFSIVVHTRVVKTTTRTAIVDNSIGSTNGFRFYANDSAAGSAHLQNSFTFGGGIATTTGLFTTGDELVVVAVDNGASSAIYINGVLRASGDTGTYTQNASNIALSYRPTGSGSSIVASDWHQKSVLFFNTALSLSDAQFFNSELRSGAPNLLNRIPLPFAMQEAAAGRPGGIIGAGVGSYILGG